jgi:hypothetical protein
MSWVGHKGTRKEYKILVQRSEWMTPLGSLQFHNTQSDNNTYTCGYNLVWSDHILRHLCAQATCLYPGVHEDWRLQSSQMG